jgi:hypothetical protein
MAPLLTYSSLDPNPTYLSFLYGSLCSWWRASESVDYHFGVEFAVVATASVAVLVVVTGAVTGAVTGVYTCITPGGVNALRSYISCS